MEENNRGRTELRTVDLIEVTPSQVCFPGAYLAARLLTRVRRKGKWTEKIIYLDAFVPMDLESVKDLRSNRWPWFEKMIKDGFLVASWIEPNKIPADVPQSLKTFTEPISLKKLDPKVDMVGYYLYDFV